MTAPNLTTRDLEPLLNRHAEPFSILTRLLLEENQKINLTRITQPQQIRLRHYLDCLMALPILDALAKTTTPIRIIDIGSGAGFPVLPLAIVRPAWTFVSVEATGKKAAFQQKACRTLGLAHVQVISARAEELAHQPDYREQFHAATARALANLSILAELSLAFIQPGGRLLAWKGPHVNEELKNAQKAFQQMGAARPKITPCHLEDKESEQSIRMNLVIADKHNKTPYHLPRPFAQIKTRPL